MSTEGAALARQAREAAGSMQAKMIPGLSALLLALAAWVDIQEARHGAS